MLSTGLIRWRLWAPMVLLAIVSHMPSKAQGQVAAPRRLRFKVLSSSKLLVSWREPKEDYDSYLFLYNSIPGGQQREIIVSKSDNKVLIKDYKPSKDYIVSVIAVSGSEQSRPLQGRLKAEKGESAREKSDPPRPTDSVVPLEDANEILGGRTNPHTCISENMLSQPASDTLLDFLRGIFAQPGPLVLSAVVGPCFYGSGALRLLLKSPHAFSNHCRTRGLVFDASSPSDSCLNQSLSGSSWGPSP
ncbi:collagen alpha-1(XIV) chain-like [Antennarius striatus]|uniref:collagen alpha-1(XIV) chain-like n=1 Tax=Antennarius striatus TaxID=241820 RepID=UPI0035B0F76F